MDGVNDYGGDFDWDHLDEVLARIRAENRAAKQRREGADGGAEGQDREDLRRTRR
jgi:hypothetical protein